MGGKKAKERAGAVSNHKQNPAGVSEKRDPSRRPRSAAEGRLGRLRGELVLQLYMRRGPLLDAVREMRDRWNVAAKVQLPPRAGGRLLPENAPDVEDCQRHAAYFTQWRSAIDTMRKKVDPESDLTTHQDLDRQLVVSWETFLSACVLYDPPDDQLVEFVEYSRPEPTYIDDGPFVREDGDDPPSMTLPPVKTLWSLARYGNWYWLRVLEYLSEQYLRPQGVDASALLEGIEFKVPGLVEEFREKVAEQTSRYFIEVSDYTSEEDVRRAFHLIANSIERRKGTKPSRDRLKAVQCALLHDRYNDPDPDDRRIRKWSYAKLGEEFGFGARAAKDHVVLGRKILEGRVPEQD